ncbi:hypothetical protein LOTGIDRAFT_160172 [Lottia gigantea]|uniref:G-protein coupled receptors family 1 profile domain-containing protein n=1 Tax=Lottia gigantea TaxID=225164 RepID=V4C3R1_LOTGI|nr:hypothetical protein LOTGIDRAFT_160172 [Lottia gigantea]ESO96184.1 hypothetical protein LOTGIDRAFT_160172 [Lottia gigantea]
MSHHIEFGGCKFVVTVATVTAVSTGQCLVAIAALRFNAVCRPLKQTISNKTARCLTVMFFLIACAVSWPSPVIITNVHKSLGDDFYVTNCASSPEYEHTVYPFLYSLFQFLLFIGTFLSISVLYCITGSRLWKRKKYGISCRSSSRELTSSTSSEKYFEQSNLVGCISNDTVFSICQDETKSLDRTLKSNEIQSNVINQNLTQVKLNTESQNLYDLNQLSACNVLEQSKFLRSSTVTYLSSSIESNTIQTSNAIPTHQSRDDESNTIQTNQSSHDESTTIPTNQSTYDESNTIQTNQSRHDESNTIPTNQSTYDESNTIQTDQSSHDESNTIQTNQSSYDESNAIPTNKSCDIESKTIPANQSSTKESITMSKIQSRLLRSNSLPSHQSRSIISDSFSKKRYASFRNTSSNFLNQSNDVIHNEQTRKFENPIYHERLVTNVEDQNEIESPSNVEVQDSENLNQSNSVIEWGHNQQTKIESEDHIDHERSFTNADDQVKSSSPISVGVQSSENLNQSSLEEFNQDQNFDRPPDSSITFYDSEKTLKESTTIDHRQKKAKKRNSIITGSNKLDPVKMLVIMALIFFLSYVPHLTLMIYIEVGYPIKLAPVSESIIGILIRSYFLGSVCNPILYGCYNRKFRDEVKSIWKNLKRSIKR